MIKCVGGQFPLINAMLGCCVLDIWGMTWKTTATLLLSVPELLAPLALTLRAGRFIRFVTGTSGDSRQQNLSGGRFIPMRSRNSSAISPDRAWHERRITHETFSERQMAQRRFQHSPAVNHGVYYVHDSIRGWLPKPKRRCRMHPRCDGRCTV